MNGALTDASFLADRALRHALLIGGGGVLGTQLTRRLTALSVRTTCLLEAGSSENQSGEVEFVRGTLGRFHWHTLERDPPDVIFHLDSRGSSRGFVRRARNRIANERLLLALAGWQRPPLVVFVWGGGVAYGSQGEALVTESTPIARSTASFDYYRAEGPWSRTQRHNDVPVIVTRTAWVLSPMSFLVNFYRRFIREERALPVVGTGENWMSFVHVDDCAGFLLHVARHALPGGSVNVFTGEPVRQSDVVQRLSRATGLPIRAVSPVEAERRFGRAARQAFQSSARMATLHTALHAGFQAEHTDVAGDLAKLLLP